MTPEELEKVLKNIRKQLRCLSCDVNELTSLVNELTTTSTTTTTTEAP
jgi:hypothetical protein